MDIGWRTILPVLLRSSAPPDARELCSVSCAAGKQGPHVFPAQLHRWAAVRQRDIAAGLKSDIPEAHMKAASRAAVVALATAVVFVCASAAFANTAPVVSNVVATQIAGTGQVRVTYDVSDADGDQIAVRLMCSADGGTTFDMLPVSVSGDANRAMAAGAGKQIVWNAAADYPGRYFASVVAKVIASDGPASSGEMVLVPAGSFTMGGTIGDQAPVRNIYLDAYYVDKFEVTNAQYQQFIDAGGYNTRAFWSADGWAWRSGSSISSPDRWGVDMLRSGPNWPGFPVSGVSYYEAEAYAAFVGKRLPTEAEWEKAARGSDARSYPWGSGIDGSRANYSGSGDPYESLNGAQETPVGFYDGRLNPSPVFQTTDSPSPYGAYDVGGNLAEWVKDWYGLYETGQLTNPEGPISGIFRVFRGGSWARAKEAAGCATRLTQSAEVRMSDVGFRCARTGP
jgi:sulfatase modifying factor 1